MSSSLQKYPFEAGSLTDVASAHELFDRYPHYRSALTWLTDFVAEPDPRINRPGAVCPRVAPAVKQNQIWLVTIPTDGWSLEEAVAKGNHLADLYHEVMADPQDFRNGALLGLFPAVPVERAAEFIDAGHARLRMDFVSRGLMLGEFHPESKVASVRNPEFLVMRCPVPMFAVRALTIHDLMFLDTPQTLAADRYQYLKHYLDHLDDQLTATTRERALAGMRAAETEL